jgi:hypothetical protein
LADAVTINNPQKPSHQDVVSILKKVI